MTESMHIHTAEAYVIEATDGTFALVRKITNPWSARCTYDVTWVDNAAQTLNRDVSHTAYRYARSLKECRTRSVTVKYTVTLSDEPTGEIQGSGPQ